MAAERSICAPDKHQWSDWVPGAPSSQAKTRICHRCGWFEQDDKQFMAGMPKSGRASYRQYVGAGERYDLIAAMTFNLLTTLGVREHHRVLDIGCGSLRNGRLLIPYLNAGNYVGFDPAQWAVEEAIKNETGEDLIRIKQARFFFSTSPADLDASLKFDYAFAQGIFVHSPMSLINGWLAKTAACLEDNGLFVASFGAGETDYQGDSWVYPSRVTYRMETMQAAAERHGFVFRPLHWRHPHGLEWVAFARPAHDTSWFTEETLTWNHKVDVDPDYRIWSWETGYRPPLAQ